MANLTDTLETSSPELLARLRSYLAQDPHNPRLLADVADAELQLGLWSDARSTLHACLALQPKDTLTRYRLSVVDLAEARFDSARSALAELLADGHDNPAVRINLARCQSEAGHWAEVAATLSSPPLDQLPAELLDDWALPLVRACHHCGNVRGAIDLAKQWKTLAGIRGLPAKGRAALITVLLDAEEMAQATEELKACSRDEVLAMPELATAAGYLALGEAKGQEALAWFRQSLVHDANNARAQLGEGLTVAMLGQPDVAIKALRAAAASNPSHLGTWHALAWVQLLTQDLEGAQQSIDAAMSRDANFGESHGGLALMSVLRGNDEMARQHLRTAYKLDPRGLNAQAARWMLEHSEKELTPGVLQRMAMDIEQQAATPQAILGLLLKRWRSAQIG